MKMPMGFEQCATDNDYKEAAAQVAARVMLALKATFEAEIAKEALADRSVPSAKVIAGYVGAHHFSSLVAESLIKGAGVPASTISKTLEAIGVRTLDIYARGGSKLVTP